MNKTDLYFDVGRGPVAAWLLVEVRLLDGSCRVIGICSERYATGRLDALQLAVGVGRDVDFGRARQRCLDEIRQQPHLQRALGGWFTRENT